MFKVYYFNGSFVRADKESSKDVEQVGNAIIIASNEGWPYRGKPEDLAGDFGAPKLAKPSGNTDFGSQKLANPSGNADTLNHWLR